MTALRKLKRVLLGERSAPGDGVYPSIEETLAILLGRKLWERVRRVCPDERQWVAEGAKALGIGEVELLKRAAEEMDVSVLVRPKPFDIEALPYGITLVDLKKAGILPITLSSEVTAVACADPKKLTYFPSLYRGSTIHLALWPQILGALDESEHLFRERQRRAAQEEEHAIRKKIGQVLGAILQRIAASGTNSFNLEVNERTVGYHFTDKAGQQWRGSIQPEIGLLLDKYLAEAVARREGQIAALVSEHTSELLEVRAREGLYEISLLPVSDPSAATLSSEKNRGDNVVVFPASAQKTSAAQPTVVLLDDNQVFLQVLQRFLKKEGIKAFPASSSEEAIRLIEKHSTAIDVIVSDVHFSGGGGLHFISLLKENELWKDIPIIALSNDESVESELRLVAAGAAAYLSKAREPKVLSAHIKAMSDKRRNPA